MTLETRACFPFSDISAEIIYSAEIDTRFTRPGPSTWPEIISKGTIEMIIIRFHVVSIYFGLRFQGELTAIFPPRIDERQFPYNAYDPS